MAIVNMTSSANDKLFMLKQTITVNANTVTGNDVMMPANMATAKISRVHAGASTGRVLYTVSSPTDIAGATATWIEAAATSGTDVLGDLPLGVTAIRLEATTATASDEDVVFELRAEIK